MAHNKLDYGDDPEMLKRAGSKSDAKQPGMYTEE